MKIFFPTDFESIQKRMHSFDPIHYGDSRNYIDGGVSALSPYISRGFLSTKQVFLFVLSLNLKPYKVTKFVQELAWRDYFQQVWKHKKEELEKELKQSQLNVRHYQIPKAILKDSISTGISSIDRELIDFYENGYLHNHVRMYLSSIICNVGGAHWKMPSEWMYYYLLDADYASNTCSWQWVAGAFSSKKYIANQENLNRYLKTQDQNTYLDKSYEDILRFESLPKELQPLVDWDKSLAFQTTKDWFYEKKRNYDNSKLGSPFFDSSDAPSFDMNSPTLIYDFYNLDPQWHRGETANRIFLLRPSFYEKYPTSPKTLDFIYNLSKNIPDIQFFWGEWNELWNYLSKMNGKAYWKEHPTNTNFVGIEEQRDWMFPQVNGYFPSFFTYWKKCEKYWERSNMSQPSLFDE